MSDAVTSAIPGGKRPSHVEDNVTSADFPALSESTMKAVHEIYEERICSLIHYYW